MRVIAGKARGIQLKTPEGLLTRPTADRVKEALFSIIQFDIVGATVLDLFGGTGQLGIEALSRGAEHAVFVDASERACNLIRENLRRTGFAGKATVVCCDYLTFLNRNNQVFRIIFLDPPYAETYLENALERITEIDILQSNGIIVTERPLGKDIQSDFQGLTRSRDYKYGKTLLTFYRKMKSEII